MLRADQAEALPAAAAQPQPQPQQQMHVLVRNEEVLPCALASGPWLEAVPRGAYTTARTVGGDAVLELSFHLTRLATSARLMMDADAKAGGSGSPGSPPAPPPAAAVAADPAQLKRRVLASLRAAVRGYRAATGDAQGELKLTVLVTWQGSHAHELNTQGDGPERQAPPPPADPRGADIWVHVSPLPPRPAQPVRAVIRGVPRQNAAAKDSEWVRARKALERGLPPDVNEVLLADAGGSLFEGLSSNFFAVLGGTLYTAGEGILAGTVREVALQVARREGIPVVLQPPRLSDLEQWEGCFITSTSRLLLPLAEVDVLTDSTASAASASASSSSSSSSQQSSEGSPPAWEFRPVQTRRFLPGGLVGRLEQLVLAELAACSEPLSP